MCKCKHRKYITYYLPVSIGSGRQLLAFSFGVERSQCLYIWPTHRRPTSGYLMLPRTPVQQRHMRRGELEVGQVRLASRATCWNVPGVGRPDMSSSHSASRVRKELHYWEPTQICDQRDFTRARCSWHQVRRREQCQARCKNHWSRFPSTVSRVREHRDLDEVLSHRSGLPANVPILQ